MSWQIKSYSKWAVILAAVFVIGARFSRIMKKEISFDILGYYMYLPATFIHDDPLLTDISWLRKEVYENKRAGTMYMVARSQEGDPMYFFLMGMSLFFLPWFLIGHAFAYLLDFPPDGFSAPYVYSLILGGVFYTVLGLVFLRKILLKYFSDLLSAVLIVVLLFGTNTVHHLIAKNLETVNVLFMLCALIFYLTIKWHEQQKPKYLYVIGAAVALMTLVKPSEVLIGIFPLLYGVYNKNSFLEKVSLLKTNYRSLIITCIIGSLVLLPQSLYWFSKTGRLVYDTYQNPGVGIDWWNPHTYEVLFSYRKGWFLYTPIMIFALLGFAPWIKKRKDSAIAGIIYFSISFFIMTCWTEWWYGSSFSCRPVITLYPILIVSLGFFFKFIWTKKKIFQLATVSLVLLLIGFNQFQWWQFRNWILDDSRMTKAYYWDSFLSTKNSQDRKELLLFRRDPQAWAGNFNRSEYRSKPLESFELKGPIYNEKEKWNLNRDMPYSDITNKSHVFLKFTINYNLSEEVTHGPDFTVTVFRENGNYGYKGINLTPGSNTKELYYCTPPIREIKDLVSYNVWDKDKVGVTINSVKVEVFEPIND